MSVNILQEKSKRTGLTHLIMDVHYKGRRKKTSLKLSFRTNPTTIQEKNDRKEKLMLAKQIALQKEYELSKGDYQVEIKYNTGYDFVSYAQEFIKNHSIKEIRKFEAALYKLIEFDGRKNIACYEITNNYLRRYVRFLESSLNGETPANYFKKIKQITKAACNDRLFKNNPTEGIAVKSIPYIKREVLTSSDLMLLWETSLVNDEVKRAFLFCCFTGLRFCDIVTLRWANINVLSIELIQQKTKIPLEIPLTAETKILMGTPKKSDTRVFKLPSHTTASKWLRHWTKAAGINKKITWHCARHSFGTNLISNGVDVSIASKLLGHTSLVNTQRYVKVNEQLKIEAIAKLPSLNLH